MPRLACAIPQYLDAAVLKATCAVQGCAVTHRFCRTRDKLKLSMSIDVCVDSVSLCACRCQSTRGTARADLRLARRDVASLLPALGASKDEDEFAGKD